MNPLHLQERTITLDDDGYLQQLEDWSPEVAEALAAQFGITLSEAHWEILHLIRTFYDHYQLSPANRALVRYAAQQLGPKKGNSQHLNLLFHGSPARTAARLAGLPKPTNCL